jgi:hypothetical protein
VKALIDFLEHEMNTRNTTPITGSELEMMRKAIGWTVGDLAARFGVADKSAKYWERGRGGVPDDVAALVVSEHARTMATAQAMAKAASMDAGGRLLVPLVANAPAIWPNMAAAASMACAWLNMQHPGVRIESARIDARQATGDDGAFDARMGAVASGRHHVSQAQAHKNSRPAG